MSFDRFQLHPDVLRGVRDLGYTTPTPIQEQAILPIVAGRDMLGRAMTGSGKTAAFVLPILHALTGKARGTTRVLVLTPTRELAAQIAADVAALGKHTGDQGRRHLRRRRDGPPGAGAPPRRRRHRRHSRPAARPHAARQRAAEVARRPRPRRGGPHARHRLPARHPPRAAPRAREAPDAALLRHHAGARSRPSRARSSATPSPSRSAARPPRPPAASPRSPTRCPRPSSPRSSPSC